MTDVWLVARRELVTRGRSKSYLIGLAVSVLIVAILAALPRLFDGDTSYTVGFTGAPGGQLESTVTALAEAEGIQVAAVRLADEEVARAAVADGDVDAAVLDERAVLTDGELAATLDQLLSGAYRLVETERRLRAAGLDPATVAAAVAVPALERISIGTDVEEVAVRRGIAVAVVLVMFMLIYVPSIYVAMGVVEEKSSRVVELLLSAVRPWQLLAGKIIGIGLLSFAQLAAIAAAGIGVAAATGLAGDLPPGAGGIIAGTFVWFLLGYTFFATLSAALSSLVSRQEDVNGVLTPVSLLIMAAYLAGFFAVGDPTGPVARTMSITPPVSAIVMPVRAAATTVPVWEMALAAALMVLASAIVLAVAARIYERAVLRTGARVKLTEVLAVRRPAARS